MKQCLLLPYLCLLKSKLEYVISGYFIQNFVMTTLNLQHSDHQMMFKYYYIVNFTSLAFGLVSSDDDNWARSSSGNPVEEPEANERITQQTNFTTKINTTRNAWQSPAVARQAHRMLHALRRPAKTPLTSDGLVAFAACATLSGTRAFHSVNTAGVFGVHNAFFVPGDQTRLPREFGANHFSGSCHPL